MATVRVKSDVASAVLDPESGAYVALIPDAPYDSKHPLVREYPWAFTADNDIEQASAAPGEKRNR
jgi:hypothetical protein